MAEPPTFVGAEPPTPVGGELPTPHAVVRPAAVAAHLEALNLAGVGFSTRRLLGKDATPVTHQFTLWSRQELPSLPSLTDPLWAALQPLRIGMPQLGAAAVCDQVLRARERDTQVATSAATECATAGKAQFKRAPLVLDPQDTTEEGQARTALVDVVKDYWRAVGTVYGEVRPRVISGDHDRAVRMLTKAEQLLADMVQQVAVLAAQVAGDGADLPAPADVRPRAVVEEPRPPAQPVDTHGETPVVSGQFRRAAGALGDPTLLEGRAEAFARAQPVREEEVVAPRPVEVLSTRPVRNHVILPIVFALAVAGLALFVILQVLNGPNPLAQ